MQQVLMTETLKCVLFLSPTQNVSNSFEVAEHLK